MFGNTLEQNLMFGNTLEQNLMFGNTLEQNLLFGNTLERQNCTETSKLNFSMSSVLLLCVF